MIKDNVNSAYAAQLKRYLADPSAVKPLFEQYSEGKSDYTFSDYTRELEELLENLNTEKFEKHEDFCKEIKRLQLPHNLFDCQPGG